MSIRRPIKGNEETLHVSKEEVPHDVYVLLREKYKDKRQHYLFIFIYIYK